MVDIEQINVEIGTPQLERGARNTSVELENELTSYAQAAEGIIGSMNSDPTYSILNRGIESEVLPVTQRYGMGTLVWSPLAKGMLTGRIRKGQGTDLRRAGIFTSFSDEARLDAVEQIVPLAKEAGLPMTHLAMAFAVSHPGVTSAILGPRTMEQLDDLLASLAVSLSDEILDRIDEIVPPGTDVGTPDQSA